MATNWGANSRLVTRANQIEYDFSRTPGAQSDTNHKESFAPNLVNASYLAIVRWDLRRDFVTSMLGQHTKLGAKIRRVNPEPHFEYPELYCVGCDLTRNLGAFTYDPAKQNAPKYEYAEYQCTFAAFLYDVKDDDEIDNDPSTRGELLRYVERKAKQMGQSLQVNGIFEYSAAPNDIVKTPPAIHVPYTQLQYIWHYVPGPIYNLILFSDAYYGRLNDTRFDFTNALDGYEPETLMYLGMDRERVPSTPYGNELWKITHNFAFFKYGWNKAYKPNAATVGTAPTDDWKAVRNRATTNPPYGRSEFKDLFSL